MGRFIRSVAVLALCSVCLLQFVKCYQILEKAVDFVELKRVETTSKNKNEVIKSKTVSSFSWSSCSQPSDPTAISSISIGPDPVKLPGNITIGFNAKLNIILKPPISLDLSIKKKELFWIPIPCVDNIGSCTYNDVCQLLPSIGCPPPLKKYGIPCTCPVNPGVYNLPPSPFYVNPVGVPSWLENGDYKVEAKLSMGSQEMACVAIQLSIG